ncbi:MAG: DUF983 domain-containing protein [Pseudolabrys sp.]|nr:DUF983 domain-containing protein [Pseudolabrys sp.]MCW5685199.1 DUF983 domain-containing protein [Pseudolabrys sp.]
MTTATGAAPAKPATAFQAMLRGFRGRCPNCGEGRMFRAFLKVADECPACGEELHHHRADDFPAYLVIVIVGHVLIPIVLAVETEFAPSYWVHLALWLPAVLIMTLGLLQPVKGAIVAGQWYGGMHGFEEARRLRELAAAQLPAR